MEVGPGVFVSNLSTEAWEKDLEVGGETHYLCAVAGVDAGLTRFDEASVSRVQWTLPGRETILVLEGEARIEIAGGPTLELKAGDMASMPAGAETTWHLTLPYREFWVIA